MKKYKHVNQAILTGMEQALCACGCGQYFIRVKRGRKRLYINDTHKKRVMRSKRKERASETRVRLTPKGQAFVDRLAGREYENYWATLTNDEQWVLHLANQHPSGARVFWETVMFLYNMPKSYLEEIDCQIRLAKND